MSLYAQLRTGISYSLYSSYDFSLFFTLAYMFHTLLYNVQIMSQYTLSNVHTLIKKQMIG
jgi:hypothetical protein